MVEGDIFREVDKELRRERAAKFWENYGIMIIGGAVAVVLAVSGIQGWRYYSAQQAAQAGGQFETGMIAIADGKAEDAARIFEVLANSGPSGYRALAKFRLAGQLAEQGMIDEAVAAFDAIAEDAANDAALQGFAQMRAAMLRVDTADFAEMQNRLKVLADESSAWRQGAWELLGLSAYRTGNMAEATRQFRRLLVDRGATGAQRQRAQVMLALAADVPNAGGAATSAPQKEAESETETGAGAANDAAAAPKTGTTGSAAGAAAGTTDGSAPQSGATAE